MSPTSTLFGLEDFVRGYIRGIDRHQDVHTEHLAEAVRSYFALPAFPTLRDLNRLCERLGIPVKRLPAGVPMDGANIWPAAFGPEIYVRDDLKIMRLETTIGHEVREVIERAFARANPNYVALDISDNKLMNRESDHFAGCLLMQPDASRKLLKTLDFDLPRFSRQTGRSLPSVVMHLQSLYSVASGQEKPNAAVWLFDAPWEAVEAGSVDPSIMVARYQALMCGFSMKKSGSQRSILVREVFPAKGSRLSDFAIGRVSVEDHEPRMEDLKGFDMFEDHDYLVAVEPIYYGATPWRLLATAIRKDGTSMFDAWIKRLDVKSVLQVF